jgi:3-hydroxy-3-methylglutaryl CoA synthase
LSELTESESTIPYFRYEKHEGKQFSIFDADYVVFHSPYNKVPETHILYDFKISVAKCT